MLRIQEKCDVSGFEYETKELLSLGIVTLQYIGLSKHHFVYHKHVKLLVANKIQFHKKKYIFLQYYFFQDNLLNEHVLLSPVLSPIALWFIQYILIHALSLQLLSFESDIQLLCFVTLYSLISSLY